MGTEDHLSKHRTCINMEQHLLAVAAMMTSQCQCSLPLHLPQQLQTQLLITLCNELITNRDVNQECLLDQTILQKKKLIRLLAILTEGDDYKAESLHPC